MFKTRKVASGVVPTLAALIAALPAHAWAQDVQQLQRVEVTGSAIKRTDVEGPAPVEIITRKDIAKTGATSVNELVRSIPSIDVFDQGEVASNAPSGSGTTTLRLRGLSESNLLVLLNGRRLPVNALYDASGAGAAFDVNLIPITAIERIEILKDGGSAIYGADAVAGVFNIITRTDYQGMEATASYGTSSRWDAQEKRGSITGGFGDLTKDRFNILASVDLFKRNPILRADRDLTNTVDGRSKGGTDGRSSFSPTGNVVDPNSGANVGIPYRPCPPENLGGGNICRFDFNKSILTSYNGADRLSGIGIASYQLTPDIKAFAELTYARTKDNFQQQPAPDFFQVPLTDPSQLPFAADDAGQTVIIGGRFLQSGPRTTDRKSQLVNTVFGLEGTNFGLDWKINAGRGQSRVTNSDSNYLNAALFDAATSSGQIDPTISTNNQAAVDALKVSPVRAGVSTVEFLNVQVSGDAFKLPAGPLRYAVGGSFWREDLVDRPDPLQVAGAVLGGIQQAQVSAARNVGAVFGELSVPVLPNLEGQLAARYDKYPNASQTSPKVALKYTPIPQFAVRASYTESFKAAELKQLFGAQEQGAATLTDPAECAALGVALSSDGSCTVNAFTVSGSNVNLKPEKGKTLNLGTVFEAGPFSGSLDYWRIKKTDDITEPTIDSAIQQGFVGHQGPRILIFTTLQNIAEQKTSGVDLDMRLRFPGTPVGNVTLRDAATYYFKNTTQDQSGGAPADFSGTYATPRYRNVFIASTDYGPWSATASVRTVGGFYDTDNPFPIAPNVPKVASDTEVDVQAQYTGWKNLTLTGGVRNLFDRMPPFSNFNLTHGNYTQEGFAELYNVRGAFYYLSVNYKFF